MTATDQAMQAILDRLDAIEGYIAGDQGTPQYTLPVTIAGVNARINQLEGTANQLVETAIAPTVREVRAVGEQLTASERQYIKQ